MTRRRRQQAQLRMELEPTQPGRLRRWLPAGVAVSLLGLGSWAGVQLLDPATFPVRKVQLVGTLEHVEAAQLREAVLPFAADGLVRLDMDGVRAAVEGLPWVYSASVRRSWPDLLRVEVTEQVAVARWNGEALVNPQGRLFSPPQSGWPQSLPLFRGPEGSAAQLAARYGVFRQILAPLGLAVATVNMDERRAWRLTLDNGVEVMLGREDAEARLERFVRVYPKALAAQAGQLEKVDLRYTNGFSVAWRKAKQETDA